MVEISNQRKAFLDMLAWSEGTDNGRQKTEIMVMTSLWAESYLLITPITLANLSVGKTQISRRAGRASCSLVGCLPQTAWPERLLSEKSGRCGIATD